MNKGYTFDDMINTMMPLPLVVSNNGDGIYCSGKSFVSSLGGEQQAAGQDNEEQHFTLTGIAAHYCID